MIPDERVGFRRETTSAGTDTCHNGRIFMKPKTLSPGFSHSLLRKSQARPIEKYDFFVFHEGWF
jgi:hypothetical protein